MADHQDGGDSRESTPEPPCQRAIPLASTSKVNFDMHSNLYGFRIGADADLIEMVRSRPVLYDPSHSRYMDNPLKNVIWKKIGKQLDASPSACKARWNNIRDNYRKALRRRSLGGRLQYKFASLLGFMDHVYKGPYKKIIAERDAAKNAANSENSNASTEAEEKTQESLANEEAEHSDDALSIKSESVVDYDMLEKSANVSGSFPPAKISHTFSLSSSQPDAVDVFLAAIGPTLKGLSPYNLSLAKAEIFATVHKYELKGIMGDGWVTPDVKHLP